MTGPLVDSRLNIDAVASCLYGELKHSLLMEAWSAERRVPRASDHHDEWRPVGVVLAPGGLLPLLILPAKSGESGGPIIPGVGERICMSTMPSSAAKSWMRIPDGTKVRLREGGQQGVIEGLTELVIGPGRNPDGRTQYRLNVGDPTRLLASQEALQVLTDAEGIVLIAKQNVDYRRIVTEQLRAEFPADRFVGPA